MKEETAGKVLRVQFPFGVLSDVSLFRADTPEEHLFANQADHLLHFRRGEEEKLVIVECKQNVLRGWSTEKARPITEKSKFWFAHYFGTAKDSKRQVRNQARALFQTLDLQVRGGPPIEGWVVHSGHHHREIHHVYDDGVTLTAMTADQFKARVHRLADDGWEALPILSSEFLSRLRLGRREEDYPHPVMIDALDHIQNSRRVLDGGIFSKLRPGSNKRSHWAISGSAGSGKSVLLAYSLCVFSTDFWIQRAPHGSLLKELQSVEDQLPADLPPFGERRIYAFAMSAAQVKALKRYFERFKEEFRRLHGRAPEMAPIHFAQWAGEIPSDCTVLAIDEAQDLGLEDQRKIAAWHRGSAKTYLAVALDHQQRLRQERKRPKIIEGLSFSRKTTTMSRNYRQTFPASITGLALLFRWFSDRGPMIQPDLEEVPTNSELAMSLRGCLGAKVTTHEKSQQCIVSMRNDSHPGNHWRRTIDLFSSGDAIQQMLENQRIDHRKVLWLRFQASGSDSIPASGFEFHDLTNGDLEAFVERRIKGLEHPIVVIEGMPEKIDAVETPESMWMSRRLLYLCTSRASAFLYFVQAPESQPGGIYEEIRQILEQLSDPETYGHEISETWRLEFKWRPNEVIGVPNFEDAVVDPQEVLAEAALVMPPAEIPDPEDLEEED